MSEYRSKYLASQSCYGVCADTQGYKDIAIGQVMETAVYHRSYPKADPAKGKYLAELQDTPQNETIARHGNDAQELINWIINEHRRLWGGK